MSRLRLSRPLPALLLALLASAAPAEPLDPTRAPAERRLAAPAAGGARPGTGRWRGEPRVRGGGRGRAWGGLRARGRMMRGGVTRPA